MRPTEQTPTIRGRANSRHQHHPPRLPITTTPPATSSQPRNRSNHTTTTTATVGRGTSQAQSTHTGGKQFPSAARQPPPSTKPGLEVAIVARLCGLTAKGRFGKTPSGKHSHGSSSSRSSSSCPAGGLHTIQHFLLPRCFSKSLIVRGRIRGPVKPRSVGGHGCFWSQSLTADGWLL